MHTQHRALPPLARFVAWEAVSSLGESAAETALLLRAGLCNVAHSRFIDGKGRRVMLCDAPALPPQARGVDRLTGLAAHALDNLHRRLAEMPSMQHDLRSAKILVALPERFAREQRGFELNAEGQMVIDGLRGSLPAELGDCSIEGFPFGRAAGALSLRRALTLVRAGDIVLWGGVDSHCDWPVLEALEQADRLITPENVDGVRPGEGAAFVALASAAPGSAVGVLGVGLGREPNPLGSDQPCMSKGLSEALEAAVAPLRHAERRTNYWLLDSTHEAFATQELQNVITRFGDVLGLQCELQTPLKELGDVGAAAMPLLATLAAEAWRLGYAIDDAAVITGCSDLGARGAALLGLQGVGRPEGATT